MTATPGQGKADSVPEHMEDSDGHKERAEKVDGKAEL